VINICVNVEGAEYWLSLSVCLHTCLSVWEHFLHQFLCMLPVAITWSSSGGIMIRYVLPVLCVTSYLHVVGHKEACGYCCSEWHHCGVILRLISLPNCVGCIMSPLWKGCRGWSLQCSIAWQLTMMMTKLWYSDLCIDSEAWEQVRGGGQVVQAQGGRTGGRGGQTQEVHCWTVGNLPRDDALQYRLSSIDS